MFQERAALYIGFNSKPKSIKRKVKLGLDKYPGKKVYRKFEKSYFLIHLYESYELITKKHSEHEIIY